MTMTREELVHGTYVRWVAERYSNSWNVAARINHVAPDPSERNPDRLMVSILSFDDMKVTPISSETAMKECIIITRAEALEEYDERLVRLQKTLLDKQAEMNKVASAIRATELNRELI